MESISTYSDAKNEYLKQLSTWIAPHMIQYYRNLWTECVKIGGEQKAMLHFQEKCMGVPKWNQDTIDENINKLLDSCRCDYLEELMAAVFIAHTKVLIAIRVSSKHKKLQITLPKLDHFLHRVYSECARGFWKAPFLFLGNQQPIEMQKNLLQAESLCNEGISSAVRSLLPIKNILNEYLSDEVNSAEPVVEDATPSGTNIVEKPVIEEPKVVEKPVVVEEPKVVEKPVVVEEPKVVEKPVVVEEPKVVEKPVVVEEPKVVEKPVVVQYGGQPSLAMLEPIVPEVAPVEQTKNTIFPDDDNKIKITKLNHPEEIVVDTKPTSVHFNNYDNVFDEANEQANTFKYAPKNIEENEVPILEIKDDIGTSLNLDASVTSLETPGVDETSIMADAILE